MSDDGITIRFRAWVAAFQALPYWTVRVSGLLYHLYADGLLVRCDGGDPGDEDGEAP